MKFFMKNVFKNFFSLMILALMLFAASCKKGGSSENISGAEKNGGNKLKIGVSFYPLYIPLMNICDGIDDVEMVLLFPSAVTDFSSCVLDAEKTTLLESCDILILNGGGLEPFFDQAVEMKWNSSIVASEGYDMPKKNPAIWTSIDGAIHEVAEISAGLSELDPVHRKKYLENASDYVADLISLSKEMYGMIDPYAGSRIITLHNYFEPFAEEFLLDSVGVMEGDGRNITLISDLVSITLDALEDKTKIAIFTEPGIPIPQSLSIAVASGISIFELDPVISGELKKDAYIEAMRKNAGEIVRAFETEDVE
ncbi:MAG: zinc ABC transporter substrate-binding protein [Treponema sp.]|nr:zinc ABC transporter substrate-binding protein [Treponema sp.]